MKHFLLLVMLFIGTSLSAQQNLQDSMAMKRVQVNKTNMYVLGSWGTANIITGAIAAGNTSGQDHYFHQMNMYWGIANLGIAAMGLLSTKKELAGPHSFESNLKEQHKIETIIAINGGLDLAYIATGAYLKERGQRLGKDDLKGYGNSLFLQGGFLLAFDVFQYIRHRKNGKQLENMAGKWQVGSNGAGLALSYRF